MVLYRLAIPRDDAWKVVETLGDMGLAHFINMNAQEQAYNLPYAPRVAVCEETDRRIDNLLNMCKTMKVPMVPPQSEQAFKDKVTEVEREMQTSVNLLFDKVESESLKADTFVTGQSKAIAEIQTALNILKDSKKVYDFAKEMFRDLLVGPGFNAGA